MSFSIPAAGDSLALLRLTGRATPWTPLLASACGLAVVGGAVAASGESPSQLYALGAATVAAGALAGLQDRAAELLEAVPASAGRRRGHRMLLLAPATLSLWALLLAAASRPSEADAQWPVGPVAALLVSGLAVATWAPGAWAAPAAAATPLVWFVLDRFVGQADGLAGTAVSAWTLSAWALHPWV
ncbi:MAG: hypothetical protein ACTHLJ_15745, partial [Angustibacter sp.]